MKASEKFRIRKITKWASIFAYINLSIFFLSFVLVFISNKIFGSPIGDLANPILIISILIGSMILYFILITLSISHRQTLLNYMRDIDIYRTRVQAAKIFNLIEENQLNEALSIYKNFPNKAEKQLQNALHYIILSRMIISQDEKVLNLGKKTFSKLKNDFDPKNISI